MLFTVSCAPKSTIHVWKDENYSQKLGKTLIIFVTGIDYIRNNFENVFATRLSESGVEAFPGNRVMRQPGTRPEREAVVARVRQLGIDNVIVARAVSEDEYSRLVTVSGYIVPMGYNTGWNSFYDDSFSIVTDPRSVYDLDILPLSQISMMYATKHWSGLTFRKWRRKHRAMKPLICLSKWSLKNLIAVNCSDQVKAEPNR